MRGEHTIRRVPSRILLVLLVLLVTRCDFPADPPLRQATVEPPAVEPSDSLGVLLPLHQGMEWIYAVEVPPRPLSLPRLVSPRRLAYEGVAYFFVPYVASQGGAGGADAAFPVLLRNDTLGLSFYQPMRMEDTAGISVRPKFMFTLPYPAHLGRGYTGTNPEFMVRLTHRDTLIAMINHPISLPCHRYEVWKGPRRNAVLYVVPGLCILRVEDDGRIFHTLGWRS
ncbi:MAG: hypothetical protein RBU27_00645 [Bacteroidota bacterium]|jgi:hypothetical protein|nr:hypothetical protein [Bacteroidota bacterium]